MGIELVLDHPAFLTFLVTAPWFGDLNDYSLRAIVWLIVNYWYSHLLNIVWIYPTIGYSLEGLAKHDYHAFL